MSRWAFKLGTQPPIGSEKRMGVWRNGSAVPLQGKGCGFESLYFHLAGFKVDGQPGDCKPPMWGSIPPGHSTLRGIPICLGMPLVVSSGHDRLCEASNLD